MPSFSDTIPQSLTQQAFSFNYSMSEKARRESLILNKDFYYDRQEQSLKLINEDEDPVTMNLTKPVIQKRSRLLYQRPLVREFEGPQESVSYLEEQYRILGIDSFLLNVDLSAELTGSCLVYPQLLPDGNIKLIQYDASLISNIPSEDDTQKPAALSVVRLVDRPAKSSTPTNPQFERALRQQIWTNTVVTTYDGQTQVSSSTNELGFIPFVNFKGEEVCDQYLGHAPGTSIRKMNANINQFLTHLGFTVKFQAATPIALSGYQSGEAITIHPGRAITLPTGATADVLSLDPKIKDSLDVIKYLEEKLYETSFVPKVSVVGGESSSGRELLIKWYPLVTVFDDKSMRYSKYELELANMILAVAKLPPLQSLVVKYRRDEVLPLSPSDDTLERDIKLGLKTSIDELMRIDPLLTEAEAEAEVRSNLDFSNEVLLNQSNNDTQSTQLTTNTVQEAVK